MEPVVFDHAGKIAVYSYRHNKYYAVNGVVSSIEPSVSLKDQVFADGNSYWDNIFNAGYEANIAVNLNSFQPELFAVANGFVAQTENTVTMYAMEDFTVPETAPVRLAHLPRLQNESSLLAPVGGLTGAGFYSESSSQGFMVVKRNDGQEIQKSGYPIDSNGFLPIGQHLWFGEDMKGLPCEVYYEWEASQAMTIGDNGGANRICRLIITGVQSGMYQTIVVDKCKVVETALPVLQREPQGWRLRFRVLKPRRGKNAVEFAYARS